MTLKRKRRISFEQASAVQREDGSWEANVVLSWPNGGDFKGQGDDDGTDEGRVRSSAEAALSALRQAISDKAEIGLLAAERLPKLEAVIVVLSLADAEKVYRLTGSASISHAPDEAVARAVLDATNRVVEGIQPPPDEWAPSSQSEHPPQEPDPAE